MDMDMDMDMNVEGLVVLAFSLMLVAAWWLLFVWCWLLYAAQEV
jgi:hypothetical protein